MTTAAYDPYADAMEPVAAKPQERTYFGEVIIAEPWHCVLQKGVGKVVFDPGAHAADSRVVAINIQIECLRQDGSAYTVDQDTVNFAKDWAKTLPSLRKINRTLRDLKGCFVQVKKVPSGERYKDKTTGEMKDRPALVFVEVYPDRTAMEAARDAFYAQFTKPSTPIDPEAMAAAIASVNKPPVAAQAAAPVPAVDRTVAAQFLPMLWNMAGGDKYAFVVKVRTMPELTPFHDIDAPEMRDILGADFDEIPF